MAEEVDIIRLRQRLRAIVPDAGSFASTRILTVASELGRNCLVHGGGGYCDIEPPGPGLRLLRLRFVDAGPGIEDIDAAFTDGHSTVGSLGFGLGGARRLSDSLDVRSVPGGGTRVTATLSC